MTADINKLKWVSRPCLGGLTEVEINQALRAALEALPTDQQKVLRRMAEEVAMSLRLRHFGVLSFLRFLIVSDPDIIAGLDALDRGVLDTRHKRMGRLIGAGNAPEGPGWNKLISESAEAALTEPGFPVVEVGRIENDP
jgi:hypothetical protein